MVPLALQRHALCVGEARAAAERSAGCRRGPERERGAAQPGVSSLDRYQGSTGGSGSRRRRSQQRGTKRRRHRAVHARVRPRTTLCRTYGDWGVLCVSHVVVQPVHPVHVHCAGYPQVDFRMSTKWLSGSYRSSRSACRSDGSTGRHERVICCQPVL